MAHPRAEFSCGHSRSILRAAGASTSRCGEGLYARDDAEMFPLAQVSLITILIIVIIVVLLLAVLGGTRNRW